MNWNIVEGNWQQFKGKVKGRWDKRTDDQIDVIAGKRVQLAGRIHEADRVAKDEAEQEIGSFGRRNNGNRPKESA
jgi:uncharacterized protein YjbJ (UPF0337 family)